MLDPNPAKELRWLDVPVSSGRESKEWSMKRVPMLDPYDIIQYLWGVAGVEVPEGQLQSYWEQAISSGLPWAQNRGDPGHGEPLRIPLKLFGDDTRYSLQSDSVVAFVLSCPLWRPHQARNSRWIVGVLEERYSLGLATWAPVLARLVWSLNQLFDVGIWAGGRNIKFEVTEIAGDWKYLRQVFALRSHWNSENVCHHCNIARRDFPALPQDCCVSDHCLCAMCALLECC